VGPYIEIQVLKCNFYTSLYNFWLIGYTFEKYLKINQLYWLE